MHNLFNSGSATQSIADFEFRWRHWQTEVRSRIDEGDFAADSKLSAIAGLLSGSDTAYLVSKLFGTLLNTIYTGG